MKKRNIKLTFSLLLSLLLFLLLCSDSSAQNKVFKLGYTGMYPNYYGYETMKYINWGYYHEMNSNMWQGWWIGAKWKDREFANSTPEVLAKLRDENINMDGYFEPDTIRWAGYGREQINEAEEDANLRFRYTGHWCGENKRDDSQWGTNQWVRYFNKNANCNEQSPAGLVLWNVYENGFQSLTGLPYDPKYQIPFPYNDGSEGGTKYLNKYYVKPRMRISVADANGPVKNVVKVIVKKFIIDPVPAAEFILTTEDFRIGNTGQYDGRYLEDYGVRELFVWADILNQGRPSNDVANLPDCHVDYQIYWYGEVSVWLDYVKVQDEGAYHLLNPNPEINHKVRDAIEGQINYLQQNDQGGKMKGFYLEELDYSNLACLEHLNKTLLPSITSDADYRMIGLINPISYQAHLHSNYHMPAYGEYITRVSPPVFMEVDYQFIGDLQTWKSKLPNNLSPQLTFPAYFPQSVKDDIQGVYDAGVIYTSNSEYNADLQQRLTNLSNDLSYFNSICKPPVNNIDIIYVPQIIFWHIHDSRFWMREPMNSEISAEFGISLCNGGKGIMPYAYESGYGIFGPNADAVHGGTGEMYKEGSENFIWDIFIGAGDFDNDVWGHRQRTLNVYNENKWQFLTEIYLKMKTWGPVLANSTNTSGYSVSRDGADHYYITDIMSIPRMPMAPYEFVPENQDQIKYWEMGFFTPSSASKYFMLVNRRCVPEPTCCPGDGDIRQLKIKFDASELPIYRTWILTDLYTNRKVSFDKLNQGSGGFVDLGHQPGDLGWFNPGEGKLFKLVPVVPGGGTLVADEVIPGTEEFICEDTVWTNGYNLTIENGAKIHFSDSAKFVVEGGTFTMGNPNQSGQDITMDAAPNGSWKGFEFHGANVGIYNTSFSGLANDSISMLTFIDCPLISLKSNSFSTGTGNNKGCVDINYTDPWQAMSNAYIGGNTFTTGDADIPAVKVMAYSGFTTPVIIEGNTFSGSNTAIFLDNIQGGAVKSNTFTEYGRSITALSSSIDVYNNTITSSAGSSYGIEALSGTELKMSYAGGFLIGGLNTITNSGTGSYNINVENSYFLMDEGENIYDIGNNSNHLYGWFPESYSGSYNETENCFKVNNSSVDPPNHYVTLGEQGSQISFTFTPYLTGCQQGDRGDMIAISLGNGIYDTIYVMGQGGSMKGEYTITPKSLYDSISISMRFRNYSNAKILCNQLLNSFPDSAVSIGAVSKLYLAVSKTDTSAQSITNLKTLYENLILNHPNNVTLVKRCNYFVQKCKVLLHQYSSALAGFQQIINQNPSNYEGLVARWDYMATSLLMQGQGGSERESNLIPLWGGVDDASASDGVGDDDDPTSPLTREEKKQIKQTVTSILEVSKTSEKKKIDVLTQLSEKGDELAAVKLKVIKALEQTVKVERPKDIVEHMRIVTNDIKKVFVNPNAGKNKNNSLIPTVFNLSQNYPNPFNPKTKINYDIPKSSFVKLIVYDILGREVIRLVNNEYKQPGRYVIEFNGTNFASGVYFYRIEASDYVMSKKMVLVK